MPRFFATNRAIEHLGRALSHGSRRDRNRLARGGYYFVDMEEYMRFYLGTTDATEMPPKAIVSNSQKVVFDDFLSHESITTIVVCVHGFNVELYEAFTWFRILTDTMKHLDDGGGRVVTSPEELPSTTEGNSANLTAFVGFSWPSDGSVLSYLSDQREAARSAAAFGSLLARLRKTGKTVNLVCHSMGNFLACHTFAGLVDKHFVPHNSNATINTLMDRVASPDFSHSHR